MHSLLRLCHRIEEAFWKRDWPFGACFEATIPLIFSPFGDTRWHNHVPTITSHINALRNFGDGVWNLDLRGLIEQVDAATRRLCSDGLGQFIASLPKVGDAAEPFPFVQINNDQVRFLTCHNPNGCCWVTLKKLFYACPTTGSLVLPACNQSCKHATIP